MMGLSDMIADFIDEMLREDDTAEVRRNDLANRFGCVPSQINYVIATRFSPERGYVVESRRGSGGYIRIHRVPISSELLLMHTVNAIGDTIDLRSATAMLQACVSAGVLSDDAAGVMLAAIGDAAMKPVEPHSRDSVRASVMKQMLLAALR